MILNCRSKSILLGYCTKYYQEILFVIKCSNYVTFCRLTKEDMMYDSSCFVNEWSLMMALRMMWFLIISPQSLRNDID